MPARSCAVLGILALLTGQAAAASAPAGLLGKSVIVSWSESRQQTFEGESQPVYRSVSRQLSIYISSAGRSFTRMQMHASGSGRLPARSLSATVERAPDDPSGGRPGALHFEGGALIIDTQLNSGARRLTITFDGAFASCNARVIYGREGGAPIRTTSMINKRRLQVNSLETSAPRCVVRDGNVFAGQ